MSVLLEEKKMVAALKKVGDLNDVKLILKAMQFDKEEIQDLQRTHQVLNEQINAVHMVLDHMQSQRLQGTQGLFIIQELLRELNAARVAIYKALSLVR